MKDAIEVSELTAPVIVKQLLKFRDGSQATQPEDIGGYTLKLIVKNSLDLPDSRAFFELEAGIVDSASGKYSFTLTLEHTSMPAGTYPGEIRIWNGPDTAPPLDAISVDFTVLPAVRQG